MSEFLTSYPRTISVIKGLQDFIRKEEIELDHLCLMVQIKRDEIITALISEGSTNPVEAYGRLCGDTIARLLGKVSQHNSVKTLLFLHPKSAQVPDTAT